MKWAIVAIMMLYIAPAWANRDGPHSSGPHSPGMHGAPGPIAGAGVPVLLVGGGIWLYRRLRRRT